jgi:hypothetical protein
MRYNVRLYQGRKCSVLDVEAPAKEGCTQVRSCRWPPQYFEVLIRIFSSQRGLWLQR